jgi:NAD+-dependent secondary alcohol dehydrogenase Adh1
LGHIGIQVLRALASAQIISVDRSEEALALATKVGAHHAVLAQGRQVDDVLALTDGKGADVVIDFVGEGGTESDAIRMLRGGGTYFVVGYGGALNVPTIEMILREINIVGNLVGTYNELGELMTLASRGLVELHTQTYPLEAAPDAIGDLDAGRVRGRGILVP